MPKVKINGKRYDFSDDTISRREVLELAGREPDSTVAVIYKGELLIMTNEDVVELTESVPTTFKVFARRV